MADLKKKVAVGGGFVLSVAAVVNVEGKSDAQIDLEAQIRKDIAALMENPDWDDGSLGPLFVRLAWHSSGTFDSSSGSGGSGLASMRFEPEASWGANAGLAHARAFLDPIKKKYPNVSYADLWTLAGAVAVEEMGGPKVPWRGGRVDGLDENCYTWKHEDGTRLPDASQDAAHIRKIFGRMGFTDREMVALIGGGHSIGRCHDDRSGFSGPWTNSPTTFSNQFFVQLLESPWVVNTKRPKGAPKQFVDPSGQLMMLPTDLALRDDPEFRKFSEEYARDENALFRDFAKAFQKLEELGCKSLRNPVCPVDYNSGLTPAGYAAIGGVAAVAVLAGIFANKKN